MEHPRDIFAWVSLPDQEKILYRNPAVLNERRPA
jgi:hypothetical protein